MGGALVGGETGWDEMVWWGGEVDGVSSIVIRWERGQVQVQGVVGYLICEFRTSDAQSLFARA